MDGRVGSALARSPRVLVVDDCETSLLFQEYALCGACHVIKARDGEEALRRVDKPVAVGELLGVVRRHLPS